MKEVLWHSVVEEESACLFTLREGRQSIACLSPLEKMQLGGHTPVGMPGRKLVLSGAEMQI